MDEGQTNNPNLTPSLTQQILGFAWHYSTHNTTQFSDWLIFQNQVFYWSKQCHQYLHPYDLSLQDYTTHTLYTYIHVMHLTSLWKNHQAYHIGDSV